MRLQYCDGGSFSGTNDTVTKYNGTNLFYRGKRIREAVFDSLHKKHNMGAATDVVVSGCSAGGLATFLHTDQWCDALLKTAPGVKCVGMVRDARGQTCGAEAPHSAIASMVVASLRRAVLATRAARLRLLPRL